MDPTRPSCPTPSRLDALRSLVPKILIGQEPVTALEKVADLWLLSCPSRSSFGEECELVTALLYTTLTIPDGFTLLLPQELVFTFLERWVEDGGKMEFLELMSFLKLEWKCGAAQVLFLLCANLMPDDWGQPVLKADVTAWTGEWLPNMTPPPWLLDASGSSGGIKDFITLLRVSAVLLQDMPIPRVEMDDSYLGTLTRFLYGVSQYQQGEYSSSIDTLQKVSFMACEGKIQAWVSHLAGLGLAKIGKPQAALIKLQNAVDRSPASIPALYNIAQVFHNLGQQRAELEVLDLLVKSGRGKMEGPSVSLHSSLLALHHTFPEDLISRAQYSIACRYLQEKRFAEAVEYLEMLLNREVPGSESLNSTPRSLLRPEDTLPGLPTLTVLQVLAAMAHASAACHKETLTILNHNLEESVDGSTFYQDSPEDRMRVVVLAAGRVLRAEALKGLGQETEALKECVRTEQTLWWVRGISDGTAADDDGCDSAGPTREWDTVILQIKTSLYKMLSELHKTRCNLQNHHHYTRLARQCLDVLGRQVCRPGQELSSSNQLAMEGIYEYFKNQLNDHS